MLIFRPDPLQVMCIMECALPACQPSTVLQWDFATVHYLVTVLGKPSCWGWCTEVCLLEQEKLAQGAGMRWKEAGEKGDE